MPPDPLIDEDEQYASSEDSDFRPDDGKAVARESADSELDSNSDSDSDVEPEAEAEAAAETETKSPVPAKRRREDLGRDGGADDAGFDNSGDEALIGKAKKRQKKKQKKKQDKEDEGVEEGGEGGVVKTRSMRAAEKVERKQATAFGPVTIDVDAVWARMKAGKAATPPRDDSTNGPDAEPEDPASSPKPKQTTAPLPPTDDDDPPAADADTILIKRKYNFAGKIHTEEKLVPRDSAEAKLYLESLAASPPSDDAAGAPSRPAPRRAFRSAFEPVLEPLQRRGDLNLCLAARLQARDAAGAKKLTTVEKSRMDWAGFVDREGIKDDLVSAGKSKESYVEREGFLARSEARREEDARRARVSAMG